MATVLMLFVRRRPRLLDKPVIVGMVYGLITYVVMNLIIVPLRFGAPLPPSALSIATQLFAHIVLVGIPIALLAARYLKPRMA
jgi:membrane associated rhomboid family serine protease